MVFLYRVSLFCFFLSVCFYPNLLKAKEENNQKIKEENVPLLFDSTFYISEKSYFFSYDVSEKIMRINRSLELSEKTFSIKVENVDSKGKPQLEIECPDSLFSEPQILILTKSGQTIFEKNSISPSSTENGRQNFILDNWDLINERVIAGREPIKICLSQLKDKLNTRICSGFFGISKRDGKTTMNVNFERRPEGESRVLVDGVATGLEKEFKISQDGLFRVFIELKDGMILEMVNQPSPIEILEIIDDTDHFLIMGTGTVPVGGVKKEKENSLFLDIIPFDSTIGDLRDYYHVNVDKKDPRLLIKGKAGGLFEYRMKVNRAPKEADRVYAISKTPNSSYVSDYKVYLVPSNHITFKTDVNDSVWINKLEKAGEFNQNTLEFETENGTQRAFLDVYRGYSQELSLKLTAIKSVSEYIALGEITYNKWFQDFGTRPGSLLYQRLGIGLNYFKSLAEIPLDDSGTKSILESTTLSLKYRFTPGLWNWDESWGPIFTYQTFKYEDFSTPLAGVGLFWARSMPSLFDSIFNIVPFFRYPKWVDMDFVYFVSSLDPSVISNGSMMLNFHGKILWSKRVYGEAGFGYKAFSLENSEVSTELKSFYVTVGMGLNF